MPSVVVDIAKVMVDIAAEYSRSLHGDTSRYYVGQNTIGLEAIGIFY
jgi:hypothetical protein